MIRNCAYDINDAELAELADALDSGSSAHKASGFKSRVPHLNFGFNVKSRIMLTSLQNPLVKQIRKLHASKQRREQGVFLIEGTHLLEEACAVDYPLITVCFTPNGSYNISNFGSKPFSGLNGQKLLVQRF